MEATPAANFSAPPSTVAKATTPVQILAKQVVFLIFGIIFTYLFYSLSITEYQLEGGSGGVIHPQQD